MVFATLLFWMVEEDIHGIYAIVCYIVTKNYKPILKRYKSKNNVRNGIAHDKVSAHPKAYECSMKREQLPAWIDYVICKENSKKDYLDKGLRERGKLCKHKITNQGCLTCGDYVCKNHWDSQEYKHKWKRTTESSSLDDVDEPID